MQENNQNIQLTDVEAYNICLQINTHLASLASGGKVGARHEQLQIIEEELKFLNEHYKGTALNGLLEKIVKRFNALEKEILKDLSSYKNLYGDPEKVGDGYC